MKARTGEYVSHAPHIHTVATWEGLERGDRVRVQGMRGTITFYAYTRNGRNDSEWVTVHQDGMRAIDPSKVRPYGVNRARST